MQEKSIIRIISAFTSAVIAVSLFTEAGVMADYKTTAGTSNDNGNGTYTNPVMNTDVADPDVICAPGPDGKEAYYLVSTAMQYSPGCPIMKSYDLVNWETVNNLYPTLDEDSDALALRNGKQAYGKGQWATSIRYNEKTGMFYILTFSYTTNTTQVYTSMDVENGPWKKSEFKCFHDPSIFLDTDGRIYVYYGQNSLSCKELVEKDGYLSLKQENNDPDNSGVKVIEDMGKFEVPSTIYADCEPPTDFIIRGEGTHAYKVDGRYYLISITWPTGKVWEDKNEYWKRSEVCYRSIPDENGEHHPYGPYEGMLIMSQTADFDGYVGGGGIGQGGMTNAIGGSNRSSKGNWYGLIFQDRGAVGRCPHLATVNWNTPGYEGWPMMTVAETGNIPSESGIKSEKKSLVVSDEFDNKSKKNYADIITNDELMTAASDSAVEFNLRYVTQNDDGTDNIIDIATVSVEPDRWTQLSSIFTTSTTLKYGRVEISAADKDVNFYVDDVSVTNAAGKEFIKNGEMDGSDDSTPWWWGTTTIWDNATSSNVDTASVFTSKTEYHNAAPSMYISNRKNEKAGAMQYLNDGTEGFAAETIYNASAWVKFSSSEAVQPTHKPSADEEELIVNGGFETGDVLPWAARYDNGTKVEISDVSASGNYSAYVSGRTQTSDGAMYNLDGRIDSRRDYTVKAKIRYDEGPAEKIFNMTLEHVNDKGETGWEVLGSVTAKKGEWSEINTTKTLEANIGTISNNVYLETSYKSAADTVASEDLMDFYVDDVSIVKLPAKIIETPAPGENDHNGSNLAMEWQWNHNPDNNNWSLTERPGYLRLRTGKVVENIQQARNTLTQRTFGPTCSGWTSVDVSGMKDGDYAGLAAFAPVYGFAAVKRENGKNYIVYGNTTKMPGDRDEMMKTLPNVRRIAELSGETAYFKTEYTFAGNRTDDTVSFYYSTDGANWQFIDTMINLEYSMLHFTGYKFALFNYATEEAGGYADFDYFRVDDEITGAISVKAVTVYEPVLNQDGTAVVSVSNTTDNPAEVQVYAASYENGKLTNVNMEKKTIQPGEANINITVTANEGDMIYVWDHNMKPYIAPVELGSGLMSDKLRI